MKPAKYEVEPLANAHCEVGENPLWDDRKKLVYWEDITNGYIYRLEPKTGDWERFYNDAVVGGFTMQEDGNLLLFRDHDIALLHDDGQIEVVTTEIEEQTGRFNDVMADPEGRVFAGTMGKDNAPSGGLFRVEHDGSVLRMWDGTACSNGMGFTPDLKGMYWTDSLPGNAIYLFDYNRAGGELSNRRVFYQGQENVLCDGMAVDEEGCVWSALYGGQAVIRLSPEGKLMEIIPFPVSKITSLIFGGDDLDEIYVTTAGGNARKYQPSSGNSPDGTLYRVRVGIKGQKEFRSRIRL